MRRTCLLAFLLLAAVVAPAAADDDRTHFRRTTPRAALGEDAGGTFTLGVPGGRAWGIESELRALPSAGTVVVRLSVTDDDVREAFARVAYYARATGRSRQIAVSDSEAVGTGAERLVLVTLDPPPGAVAYRVRVLARLRGTADRSRDDAIEARLTAFTGAATRLGALLSRLLPDGP